MEGIVWSSGVEDAWSKMATFVPKVIAFLLVLLVAYLVVKTIGKAVDKALARVGFDGAVEPGGIRKALDKLKYDASAWPYRLVFSMLPLFVSELAFAPFGRNPVNDLTTVVAFLPKLFVAVIIMVIAATTAAAIKEVIEAALGEPSYVALAVGVGIVAVSGGGIGPRQQDWRNVLVRLDEENPKVSQRAKNGIGQRTGPHGPNPVGDDNAARQRRCSHPVSKEGPYDQYRS